MKTKQIDYINIGLIIVSFVLAFQLPFELFLFSYAVLGPLHYMTEIGWLHKKKYFTVEKNDYWVILGWGAFFVLGITIYYMQKWGWSQEFMKDALASSSLGSVLMFFQRYATSFIFLALFSSMAMVFFKNRMVKFGMILIGIPIAFYFGTERPFLITVGIFLPTIIHVCVFTAAFMLFGALKSKSTPGIGAFFLFAICCVLFFLMKEEPIAPKPSAYVQQSYNNSTFLTVNQAIWSLLRNDSMGQPHVGFMLNIQRFIAFIYTYHYLNWFSKTKIIQWHNVSRKWMIATGVVWALSVGLYAYDYSIGFVALVALSSMHVFLEFPLNVQSFKGIAVELYRKFSPAPSAAKT